MILRFLKNWTLPVAMFTGALVYFLFANSPVLSPAVPWLSRVLSWLTPALIFAQLLLTFCKMEWRDLKPKWWHIWLLLFQLLSSTAVAAVLLVLPFEEEYRCLWQGAMVCLICPTATAAAVITAKLGGSASSLTTYTLLSNLLAALVVPWVFPLVEVQSGFSFFASFTKILSKVFPLLLVPFFLAGVLRIYFPKIHRLLLDASDIAFYLWALALAIVSGQTVRSLVLSEAPWQVELSIALVGLVVCACQFWIGKRVGAHYHDRISGGQALGQKNTVLAIWMAYTYLNPLSSVAPGSYVLWQNLFNSWQLWIKRKSEDSDVTH